MFNKLIPKFVPIMRQCYKLWYQTRHRGKYNPTHTLCVLLSLRLQTHTQQM